MVTTSCGGVPGSHQASGRSPLQNDERVGTGHPRRAHTGAAQQEFGLAAADAGYGPRTTSRVSIAALPQPAAGFKRGRRSCPPRGRRCRARRPRDHRASSATANTCLAHRVPGRAALNVIDSAQHTSTAATTHCQTHSATTGSRSGQLGPGEQPGGEHGGQGAEQQQCRGRVMGAAYERRAVGGAARRAK